MGRALDAILCRKSRRTGKLKSLLGMTVARIAVLKNQRDVRCAHARGDVSQLLRLKGQQDRALIRAETVIKEQNTLDAFVLVEGYCHILTERASLIERIKECPEDLKEAISSLIFAASRCGDLPELQKVRYMFASKFGKEFTMAAVELRNSCGVNPKLIQKLSTKQPSIENRVKVVREIAAENGITVDLEEHIPELDSEVVPVLSKTENHQSRRHVPNQAPDFSESNFVELDDVKTKYNDVVSAAQAAFESAAYAAAAARVAVELSKSESSGGNPESGLSIGNPVQNYISESESGSGSESEIETVDGIPEIMQVAQLKKSSSVSGSTSGETLPFEKESPTAVITVNSIGRRMVTDKITVGSKGGVPTNRGVSYLHPPYRKGNQTDYENELVSSTSNNFNRRDRLDSQQRPASVRTRRGLKII